MFAFNFLCTWAFLIEQKAKIKGWISTRCRRRNFYKRKHFQLIEWFMRILCTRGKKMLALNWVFVYSNEERSLRQKVIKCGMEMARIQRKLDNNIVEMYKFDSEFEIRCHLLDFGVSRRPSVILMENRMKWKTRNSFKIKRNKSLGCFFFFLRIVHCQKRRTKACLNHRSRGWKQEIEISLAF